MEDFDFNMDNDIGTMVSQLKNNQNMQPERSIDYHINKNSKNDLSYPNADAMPFNETLRKNFDETNRSTNDLLLQNAIHFDETDINYDEIMDNLNKSDIFNKPTTKPKNNININNMVRNLELDLEHLNISPRFNPTLNNPNNSNNLNNPNSISNNSNNPNNPNNLNNPNNSNNILLPPILNPTKKNNSINNKLLDKFLNCEYTDILIYSLLFIILNNKLCIDLIYKIQQIQNIKNSNLNLIIRTLLFATIIIIIKKYYINI
jgi:hypothetical protein